MVLYPLLPWDDHLLKYVSLINCFVDSIKSFTYLSIMLNVFTADMLQQIMETINAVTAATIKAVIDAVITA